MQKRHFSKRVYDPGSVLRDLREIPAYFDEFRAAVRSKRISKAFAERIMLTVTAVNGCHYCSYHHAKMALKCGVSSEEVDLLLRGEVGHVTPDEVPALLFAQHYAESGGNPDPSMLQKLVMTYGPDKSDDILAYIRMISLGNLSGNTFDALLSRLQGCPSEGSSLVSEVAIPINPAVAPIKEKIVEAVTGSSFCKDKAYIVAPTPTARIIGTIISLAIL